jgi:hypothetical protein
MPQDPKQTATRLLLVVEMLDRAVAGLQAAIGEVKEEIGRSVNAPPCPGDGETANGS